MAEATMHGGPHAGAVVAIDGDTVVFADSTDRTGAPVPMTRYELRHYHIQETSQGIVWREGFVSAWFWGDCTDDQARDIAMAQGLIQWAERGRRIAKEKVED